MSIQRNRAKKKLFTAKLVSLSFTAALLQHSGVAMAEGAAAKDDSGLEEIVISGLRAAEKNAIDIKRNADSIVDAISATDIGKLPDATITDSLQRVTGVQITRTGGEGTTLNIRGNGNVSTSLNGEQMLSAGTITTVTPDFADIPSTMVSGIEVYKSADAKNVVSGLAGTVDLKTNRPFLLQNGWTALGKVEANRGALGKQTDGTYSAFVGYNHNDDFGATLNVSKGKVHLADYYNGAEGANPEGQLVGQYAGWENIAYETTGFAQNNEDVNGNGNFNDVYLVPEGQQAANRYIDRDRTGINGSVQWKINDALQLTGDAFYTKMKEYTYMMAFVMEESWTPQVGWVTPDAGGSSAYPNITHDPSGAVMLQPGNFYTVQSGLWQARLVKAQNQTIATDKDSLNTNLELKYDRGGPFTANLRWVHGTANDNDANSTVDSTLTDGSQIGDTYRPAGGTSSWANPWGYGSFAPTLPDGTAIAGSSVGVIPIGLSYAGGKQIWTLPNTNLPITNSDGSTTTVNETFGSNLNRYEAKSTNVTGAYTNAKLNVFRLDGAYTFDSPKLDFLKSVDFGVRYEDHDVVKTGWIAGLLRTNAYGDPFVARWTDVVSPAPETGESYTTDSTNLTSLNPLSFTDLNKKGMIIPVNDFYGTKGLGTLYFINPKAMNNPLAWSNALFGPHLLVPDASDTYSLNNKVSTFYVQANVDTEIFGRALKGNFGFRYVKTKYTIDQAIAGSAASTVINGTTYLLGSGMVASVGSTITAINEYNDFLPSIQLSYDLTDDQKLRFSFTKTVGTNNTDQLGGGLVVNYTNQCGVTRPNGGPVACATSGSQNGNPTLLPPRQLNADLSYEWYFSPGGLVSLGVFFNQGLTQYTPATVYRYDIADDDGVIRGYSPSGHSFGNGIPIQTQFNTSTKGGWGRGLEFGYRQAFDFLPGFWSGFGVDGNFTYSPSTAYKSDDYFGNITPGQDNSKYQSNFALWYEKGGLQARIADNYRSKRYIGQTQQASYVFAYYQRATQYLDASISYEFYKNMTLSLQVTNITQEYQQNYNQWESNIDTTFYNERRYTLGFQAKL